uniref:5-oxoprolinase n=1 Tax=Trichuris muris TaxID=70415 RepID=A0A5S6QWQ4_TRIMR
MAPGKFNFAIDRGGTFTDVVVQKPDGSYGSFKLLSEQEDPEWDAPSEAVRRALNKEPNGQPIDGRQIGWIRMSSTVATNALLEHKGERTVLAVTSGFKDLLYIGNQSRPNLFDLQVQMMEPLYEDVIEVEERVVLSKEDCRLQEKHPTVTCANGELVEIWKEVNVSKLENDLAQAYKRGIRSVAIVLLHSYLYDKHELQVESIARKIGFKYISLSSRIMPTVRIVPRGYTASANAYLSPVVERYLAKFKNAFVNLHPHQLLLMQSDGGLSTPDCFQACQAVLSGPAGGVTGAASLQRSESQLLTGRAIIGFDMGGTSTDVCRVAGKLEQQFETDIAGITLCCPQLDIRTVAAGGGSRLKFQDGQFVVGPDSVGAMPGPLCYGRGGQLALTDANVVLNRLLPTYFPAILGPNSDESLDIDTPRKAFQALTDKVNLYAKKHGSSEYRSLEEVALGFVKVANEAMCRPIRALTEEKGYDTARHVLVCFGGASGQHACSIARALNIQEVFIHKLSSVFSAYGLALADIVVEAQRPCILPFAEENFAYFESELRAMSTIGRDKLLLQGLEEESIVYDAYMEMRYAGTDYALSCSPSPDGRIESFMQSFISGHKREFGFLCPQRQIIVDNIRVRAISKSSVDIAKQKIPRLQDQEDHLVPDRIMKCYFENGYLDTPVYLFNCLTSGQAIAGPAIIVNENNTFVVEPDCNARITDQGNIFIKVNKEMIAESGDNFDPVRLSIFGHRFMGIAEQMGKVLRRTAISTNIKERLDFSCALFGNDGSLVANAPHIPVHLGAMAETVKYQCKNNRNSIREGNVLLCNHPAAGGSHLPDLTVITPVFRHGHNEPVFFVANRGHHADIGGLAPGSMPPNSTSLEQEGATFDSFNLVDHGVFQEDALIEKLLEPGKVAGCSGCRRLDDCLADLKAQIAANRKGIDLVNELIDLYGLDEVQRYMHYIQANAGETVRNMLKQIKARLTRENKKALLAKEYMDDGTPIQLSISINEQGSAVFDFTGTGYEVLGNLNSPKAVTMAAILYSIRCLVDRDIPLNDGCLEPIRVVLPPNSILRAHPTAAVVGANVLTSQRIVDVLLKCFEACAASQGCMNNVSFGDDKICYYETVAGGCGAGPTWNGRSGTHSHMTNTRMTDTEILERQYPVVVPRFSLRHDSGGNGIHKGGDGIVREMLFRRPLTLSVLTERRVFAPYGLNGGLPGKRGLNLLHIASSGRVVNLGAKAIAQVAAGDIFAMHTPGGGGWGTTPQATAAK